MNTRRLTVLGVTAGIALIAVACGTAAPEPTVTTAAVPTGEETVVMPTEAETLVFKADPDNLQPCGAFETIRLLQTPEPVTPAPTNTPDPKPLRAPGAY